MNNKTSKPEMAMVPTPPREELSVLEQLEVSEESEFGTHDDQYLENLDDKEAMELLEKIKARVFENFDACQGAEGVTQLDIALNKEHTTAITELSLKLVSYLEQLHTELPTEDYPKVTRGQRVKVAMLCLPHDAGKLSPDRPASTLGGRGRPALTRVRRGRPADIPAEKSVMSVVDERLLSHGEDSAEFAIKLLKDLGFTKKFIQKAANDIMSHAGNCPFVTTRLETYIKAAMEDLAGTADIVLPKHLDPSTLTYPQPETVEGTILYLADTLSLGILAKPVGEGTDRRATQAGALDKIVQLEFGTQVRQGHELSPEDAFAGALLTLHNSVRALQSIRGTDQLSKIKRVLGGDLVGQEAHDRALWFGEGDEIKGFYTAGETIRQQTGREPTIEELMAKYYEAVAEFWKGEKEGPFLETLDREIEKRTERRP